MFYTILFLSSLFSYANVPFVDMREGPSADTKIESQAYYSEPVTIVEEKENWAKIQTSDLAEGWALKSQLVINDEPFLNNRGVITAVVNRCAAHLYDKKDTEYGPIKTIPFESRLEVIDQFGDPNGRWLQVRLVDGTLAYIQRGDITLNPKFLTKEEMIQLSKHFLDLPYSWGGRSSFGYDCSGFVQMLYRQMGVSIPRNSRDQVKWEGFREVSLDKMEPGDLVFFGRKVGTVSHVGLYLGDGEFIHATVAQNKPYLRISNLNEPFWNGSGDMIYRVARTKKDSI